MSLLGPNNAGDYAQIEQRRQEKYRLRKIWTYFMWFLYAGGSLSIIALITKEGMSDTPWVNFLIVDMFSGKMESPINLTAYFLIALPVFFVFWVVFFADSILEVKDNILELSSQKKKVGWMLRYKLKIASLLDQFVFWMFFPVSYIFLAVDGDDQHNKDMFFIRFGWMSHLERSFLRPTIKQTDGYSRVERLDIFKRYPLLFTDKTNIDSATLSPEFLTLNSLFRSKETFEDIFLITEGYLRSSGGKFDTLLTEKEFNKILEDECEGSLDNFRVYDGGANIYFSFDLIDKLIDSEAQKFSSFMKRYSLTGSGLEFTRTYRKYFELLYLDKKTVKMIRDLYAPHPLKEGDKLSREELVRRILYLFDLYFRFFSLFYIINQYINLPAGTVVVRMSDYTLRMITESYDNECIVSIEERKNDGSTDGFNGDALANMFLVAWNYYNHTVNNSLKERVYTIFNLRDEKIERELKGENASDANAIECKTILNTLDMTKAPEIDEAALKESTKFLLS